MTDHQSSDNNSLTTKPTAKGAEDLDTIPDLAAATLAALRRATRGPAARTKSARSSGGRPPSAQLSSAGPDERDPIPVSEGLADLVQDRGWANQAAVAGVIGRWSELAGEDLADHVRPESFDAATGLLRLRADSTSWATQIRVLMARLQARLDEEIGTGIVREIEVVGPSAPSRSYGNLRVPGRGPRDTYG